MMRALWDFTRMTVLALVAVWSIMLALTLGAACVVSGLLAVAGVVGEQPTQRYTPAVTIDSEARVTAGYTVFSWVVTIENTSTATHTGTVVVEFIDDAGIPIVIDREYRVVAPPGTSHVRGKQLSTAPAVKSYRALARWEY